MGRRVSVEDPCADLRRRIEVLEKVEKMERVERELLTDIFHGLDDICAKARKIDAISRDAEAKLLARQICDWARNIGEEIKTKVIYPVFL